MTQVILFPAPQLGDAIGIIGQIEALLGERRKLAINRRTFLKRYSQLRRELELTPEYLFVRAQAFARAKGVCEKCCAVPPTQLCHKKQVSRFPRLALATANVYAGCASCNQSDTPQFKVRGAK